MSTDLRALAREIARELSQRDLRSGPQAAAAGEVAGGPPRVHDNAKSGVERHHAIPEPTISLHPEAVKAPPGVRFVHDRARIADFIDHTLLKAEATRAEIETLCEEAREHRFAAVCVNPSWVSLCATRLAGSDVGVATVVGFPLGATSTGAKRDETTRAIQDGATEVDMVAPIGHIRTGDWVYVGDDIAAVVQGAASRLVKVIIESAALTPVEIIKVCAIAREVGAHYVKTSTGFHPAGGATAEAVALMRMVVGDQLGVKASGGVRDCDAALKMIANGATRIGTSSGVAMARCLGSGPLPVADLMSLVAGHAPTCHTCGQVEKQGKSGSY